MHEAIEAVTYKSHTIDIHLDEHPIDPRENDNLALMVCFHGRYVLGDKHELKSEQFQGWADLANYLQKTYNPLVILPLYLYDHSGLRIKVGSFQGLLPQGHAEFDSGQVGFILVPRDKALKEWSQTTVTKKLIEKVTAIAYSEVEEYDNYLTGNVYGYVITAPSGERASCWGFYPEPRSKVLHGRSEYAYCLEEAKSLVDSLCKDAGEHYTQVTMDELLTQEKK